MKNIISKNKIRELLIKYLTSNDVQVIFIHHKWYYIDNSFNYSDSIKMKDFVDFYLTEYGYYYDILDIHNKDIYELIKILLNIFKKNNSILKKYKKYYIKNKLD